MGGRGGAGVDVGRGLQSCGGRTVVGGSWGRGVHSRGHWRKEQPLLGRWSRGGGSWRRPGHRACQRQVATGLGGKESFLRTEWKALSSRR